MNNEMLKRVRHDKKMNCHPELVMAKMFFHAELISGSINGVFI